ncbi:MAG: hypothetical protein RIC55_26775 [Pirellulaceae bacterium]
MPHVVRRPVGLVEFESLPRAAAEAGKTSFVAEGPFDVLRELQLNPQSKSCDDDPSKGDSQGSASATDKGGATEKASASIAVAGGRSTVLDADLKRLTDELRAEVAQLAGRISGIRGVRHPR